jgi:hypothetical protein
MVVPTQKKETEHHLRCLEAWKIPKSMILGDNSNNQAFFWRLAYTADAVVFSGFLLLHPLLTIRALQTNNHFIF